MMRNKLFTLALGGALALSVTGAAFAQDTPAPNQGEQGRGPGRMNPDRQLEHLTQTLNLTTDQQAQIKPLLVDRQQKTQALFQNQSISEQDRHTQMRTIMEGTNNSIKALLNDEQKQKFDAMHEHMHRGGGPDAPQGGTPQPQL
jgi:Spy/CpxP family protein refolding chaperone